MSIPVFNQDNPSIDELVKITHQHQANHEGKVIQTPYRDDEEGLINDASEQNESEKESEKEFEEDETLPRLLNISQEITKRAFSQPTQPPISDAVIAVDAGVISLGELAEGGNVFAIRGAAACYPPNHDQPFVCRYNTGVLVIDQQNQLPVLHHIGHRLGKEDQFIHLSETPPYYSSVKEGIASTANAAQDRYRNFVERIIQEEAISILKSYNGGILLIDGALSATTYDTPKEYMESLVEHCHKNRIHVVAISKKTRITVGGRKISNLFYEQPEFIGYAPLKEILAKERAASVSNDPSNPSMKLRSVDDLTIADEVYAVRFGYPPYGLTFCVDIKPAFGYPSYDVVEQINERCQIYGGYPRPLIEAHQYSSFTYQEHQELLVEAIVKYGVRPQEEPSMEVLFQPFGGGFK